MVDQTDHYGLSIIKAGDDLAADGYKFSDADRRRLDYLLYLGAEGHHHIGGGSIGTDAPADAPDLIVEVEGGTLPASTTYYYGFTLVDPDGHEGGLSPVGTAITSPPVTAPDEPLIAVAAVGGTLPPGNYLYALSVWTEFSTLETVAGQYAFASVPAGTSTNVVTLTLPALPAGATGFNVYRRAPGGNDLTWVATIDMSVAVPPATLVDDGTLDEDCTRFAPTVDTSASANAVTVALPEDADGNPFVLTAGWSWRVYRSTNADDFSNSLLATIADGSIEYLDTGDATTASSPPGAGLVVGSPERIDLTDAAEVQGRLPLAQVSGFPYIHEWSFPGPVVAMEATSPWICEFPQFTVLGVRASLGKGYTPADADVIVDVLWGRGYAPDYASMFTDPADRPRVYVGDQRGDRVPPTAVTELLEGDSLVFSVIQAGGADPDTQTDRDLVVIVYGFAYGYTDLTSHPWAE